MRHYEVGSRWIHSKTGNEYIILMITNENATKPSFPVTVVYKDKLQEKWSRPLDSFAQKFTKSNRKFRWQ